MISAGRQCPATAVTREVAALSEIAALLTTTLNLPTLENTQSCGSAATSVCGT